MFSALFLDLFFARFLEMSLLLLAALLFGESGEKKLVMVKPPSLIYVLFFESINSHGQAKIMK